MEYLYYVLDVSVLNRYIGLANFIFYLIAMYLICLELIQNCPIAENIDKFGIFAILIQCNAFNWF